MKQRNGRITASINEPSLTSLGDWEESFEKGQEDPHQSLQAKKIFRSFCQKEWGWWVQPYCSRFNAVIRNAGCFHSDLMPIPFGRHSYHGFPKSAKRCSPSSSPTSHSQRKSGGSLIRWKAKWVPGPCQWREIINAAIFYIILFRCWLLYIGQCEWRMSTKMIKYKSPVNNRAVHSFLAGDLWLLWLVPWMGQGVSNTVWQIPNEKRDYENKHFITREVPKQVVSYFLDITEIFLGVSSRVACSYFLRDF